MKITGKLKNEGLAAFAKKPSLKNGKRIPRILIIAADNHLVRIYQKINGHMELIGEGEPVKNFADKKMEHPAESTTQDKSVSHTKESKQQGLIFARDISDFLEQAEMANAFDRIYVSCYFCD